MGSTSPLYLVSAKRANSVRINSAPFKMRGTNRLTGSQSVDIARKDGMVVLKAQF